MPKLTPYNAGTVGMVLGFIIAVTVIFVAVFVIAGSSDDHDDTAQVDPSPTADVTSPTPQITPPATEAPEPTATQRPGALTPIEQAETFALIAVEGLIEFATFDADEELDSGSAGAYFLDIETGDIEGLIALVDPTMANFASDDNRFVLFSLLQPTTRGGVPYAEGAYLADRETGMVWRWEGDAQVARAESSFNNSRPASQGDLVLFRIDDPVGLDSFVVVRMGSGPEIVTTFQAEARLALFSQDGNRMALFGDGVSLVEVDSGVVTSLGAPLPDRIDLEGMLSLRNTGGGEGFLLAISTNHSDRESTWMRYNWQGEVQQSRSGPFRVYASPFGEYVVGAETLTGADDSYARLAIFNAVSTVDGGAMFRVVGAIESFGYTTGDIWLADGSGFVFTDPSFEMRVALRIGELRPYTGMPSPTDADVFSTTSPADRPPMQQIRGPMISDADGNILASAEVRARSFASPWGLNGDEIRFFTPHGGHGGLGYLQSLVVPRVDQPPYQGPVALSLINGAVGMELLDAPATGAVVTTLNMPVVTVLEMERVRLVGGDPGYDRHCDLMNQLVTGSSQGCGSAPLWGVWALVTPLGPQPSAPGWLLIAVHPEGA